MPETDSEHRSRGIFGKGPPHLAWQCSKITGWFLLKFSPLSPELWYIRLWLSKHNKNLFRSPQNCLWLQNFELPLLYGWPWSRLWHWVISKDTKAFTVFDFEIVVILVVPCQMDRILIFYAWKLTICCTLSKILHLKRYFNNIYL